MPLAGARTKEDVDTIMEKTFEEVYEFGKRMGDRIGRTLIRTGMFNAQEGRVILAQLTDAFAQCVRNGARDAKPEPIPTPTNLVETTRVAESPAFDAEAYANEDDEGEEEANEEDVVEEEQEPEPEPTPPKLPPSPRSDPDKIFPKKSGRAKAKIPMKKPLVCPKCGMFLKHRAAFTLHLWNSHKEKYGDYLAAGGLPAEDLATDYEKQQAISTEKRNTGNESKNAQLLATLKKQADQYNAEP